MIMMLAAAAVLAAAPAPKGEQVVQIGAVKNVVPIPAGFCLPSGNDIAIFQALAAPDVDNVTLLSLTECRKTAARHYLLVKTPVAALNAEVSRAELLKELGDAMETPEMSKQLEEVPGEISKGKTRQAGEPTKVTGEFGPRGRDDVCVYIGGRATTATASDSQTQALAGCMTAVNGRMISLYAFADSTDAEAYKTLLPQLKAWAQSIR